VKALTIWQPWASLIIALAKPYEFRSWPAPKSLIGQRIALHAGARPARKDEIADLIVRLGGNKTWSTALKPDIALPLLERWHTMPGSLPLSSILGTAMLGTPVRAREIIHEFAGRKGLGGGLLLDSDRVEHSNWAWPLTEIQPLEPFQPAKGMQGFWDWQEHS
jgi:hypothetical protein